MLIAGLPAKSRAPFFLNAQKAKVQMPTEGLTRWNSHLRAVRARRLTFDHPFEDEKTRG